MVLRSTLLDPGGITVTLPGVSSYSSQGSCHCDPADSCALWHCSSLTRGSQVHVPQLRCAPAHGHGSLNPLSSDVWLASLSVTRPVICGSFCLGPTPISSHGLPPRVAVGSAWSPRPIGSVALGTNSPRIGNFWLEVCAGSTPHSSHGLPVRVAVGAARFPRPIGSVALGTNSPRIGNFWLEVCAGSTPYSSHGLPVRVAVGAARFPRPIGSVALGTISPRIGNFLLDVCAGSTPYSSHGLPARVAVGSARSPRPIGSES